VPKLWHSPGDERLFGLGLFARCSFCGRGLCSAGFSGSGSSGGRLGGFLFGQFLGESLGRSDLFGLAGGLRLESGNALAGFDLLGAGAGILDDAGRLAASGSRR
jgi:hypothetical protein